MKRFKKGHPAREMLDELAVYLGEDPIDFAPMQKNNELRYCLGPIYSPGVLDAHGEYATADDLRKALWKFAKTSDRQLRKQHGREKIGDIVEQVQWPWEVRTKMHLPGMAKAKELVLPPGTVYLGVQWKPKAWSDVKAGRITGFSMGGAAVRVAGDIEDAQLIKFS